MDTPTDAAAGAPQLPGAFSLFKPSWQALRLNLEVFVIQIAMPFAVAALGAALFLIGQHRPTHLLWEVPGAILFVLGLALFISLLPSLVYTQYRSARGEQLRYGDVLRGTQSHIWRLLGLTVCMGVLITGGLFLLIVPGLFAWHRFLYAPYVLVDRHLGVFAALRESAAIARRYNDTTWRVVGTQLLIEGVSFTIPILGSLASSILGIVYYCAPAVRYQQIVRLEQDKALAEAEQTKSATTSKKPKSSQSRTKKSS